MTSAVPIRIRARFRVPPSLLLSGLVVLAGCGSLLPAPPAQPARFLLDDMPTISAEKPARQALASTVSTLVVDEPRAAAGYRTRQIAYVRTPNQLEYFAFNQWVEPPALMLAPLLARAIERTGAFRAVLRAPTSAAGDLHLESELVRLQQDFSGTPSRVRLTVRAVLIETSTRRELASREFDAEVVSASDDPTGGVTAANQVAHRVAGEVGAFCAEWVANRR